MPRFWVDDGLSDHPKLLALQERPRWQHALALWTLSGSWCAKHMTDGVVSHAAVKRLGFTKTDAESLVVCRLWARVDTGFSFHNWAERNGTRESIEAEREAAKLRVQKYREKRDGNALHSDGGNALQVPPCNAAPSHPNPSQPIPTQLRSDQSARARAVSASDQPPEPTPEPVPRSTFERTPWPLADEPESDPESRPYSLLVGYRRRFEAARRTAYMPTGAEVGAWAEMRAILAETAELRDEDPEALGERALDAFFSDPYATGAAFSSKLFRAQWSRYVEPPVSSERAAEVKQQAERKRVQRLIDQDRREFAQRVSAIPIDLTGGSKR